MPSLKLAKALGRIFGSFLGPRSETRADPKPSPQRDPSFSYHKTTNIGHQSWHLGATNKPQPPLPVKLSFESARYTIPCKGPSSPDPQGRRIPRACGHMRRPWKRDRNPTSPSLRTQNSNLIQNSKLRSSNSKLQTPKSNSQLKTQTEVWSSLRSVIGYNS